MKVTVSKKVSFEAAHHLPGYDGACADVHGHRWEFEIGVSGSVNKDTGMVVDFKKLKDLLQRNLLNRLDHKDLNDRFEMPTAENITTWAFTLLRPIIEHANSEIKLEWIKVWESPDSCCEVRG